MNRDWVDKDFYQTLGVGKSNTPEEIKRAYRKLARLYHPDANPGDHTKAEKFKEISEAYSVLSDSERRKEYDEVRRLVESGGYQHFPGAGSGHGGPFGGQVNLEDLLGGMGGFGDLFGRAGRQARASKGADLTAELRLTFEESIEGVTKSIAVKGPASCPGCRGTGARAGTNPEICPACSGQGTTVQNQGLFSFSRPCTQCQGSGKIIRDPCPGCRGRGARHRTRQVRVKVPAGVKNGGRIKIRGKGAPGRSGGPSGDLLVRVEVERHPLFEAERKPSQPGASPHLRRSSAGRHPGGSHPQRTREATYSARHAQRKDLPPPRQRGARPEGQGRGPAGGSQSRDSQASLQTATATAGKPRRPGPRGYTLPL